MNQVISCFYNHFKNSPRKLRIVCDWDEVIQSLEPFSLYLALKEKKEIPAGLEKLVKIKDYPHFFSIFWQNKLVSYSDYGSRLNEKFPEQTIHKNHPEFYQKAPFLSLAQELLMLVKENKVEIFFLSAFDKEIFLEGDPRKKKIFAETFGRLPNCSLKLIGFKWEEKQKTKGEWIKENVLDCDILLDDNPNILANALIKNTNLTICAPYYPAVRHSKQVILFKTTLSGLKKEDFCI